MFTEEYIAFYFIIDGKNDYFCEVSSSSSLKKSMQKIINNKDLIPPIGNYSRSLLKKI